jgi:hypothetical protein
MIPQKTDGVPPLVSPKGATIKTNSQATMTVPCTLVSSVFSQSDRRQWFSTTCKAQHRREFELPSQYLLLAKHAHVLSVEYCALVLFGYRAAMRYSVSLFVSIT